MIGQLRNMGTLGQNEDGATWPEQEAIHAWIMELDIAAKPSQVFDLAERVSKRRIEAERELHEKTEIGVRIVQLIHKCGDTVNSRDILQTINGDHVDKPWCWCRPVQDDEEESVWIHNELESAIKGEGDG